MKAIHLLAAATTLIAIGRAPAEPGPDHLAPQPLFPWELCGTVLDHGYCCVAGCEFTYRIRVDLCNNVPFEFLHEICDDLVFQDLLECLGRCGGDEAAR